MELRNYQISVINDIYRRWAEGHKNVVVQLATGAGKTVIFSKILADCKQPSIAIAHRVELVSQISLALARYGVRHNLIAQKAAIREIVSLHMREFKRSYFDPAACCSVAGVDTLVRMPVNTLWFKNIRLVVQDEGHHPLKKNKWGRAADFFPYACGLYPTATPCRADGHGLSRRSDGIADTLVTGPSMRELINLGYLTDYRIFAPPSDLDLSQVTISASGDYSPPKLRNAVHKSHITGDVVSHYLRIAPGKLGVTFAVDIEAAAEIAQEFKAKGVAAEIITSKTPDVLRATIMQQFRERKILQIVNVDLLGEGVDVPAIEVVSMARPTHSFGLYSQQFGRCLRPMEGKSHAIIIDHVDNWRRHGLPDAPRNWTLDRRQKRSSGNSDDVIPLKTCLNPDCLVVYSRLSRNCPRCGYFTPPSVRHSPEFVDGDLLELDPNVLARIRGEIVRIDASPKIPQHLGVPAQLSIANKHKERQAGQLELRNTIALWAGAHKAKGRTDSEIYRQFYIDFKIDIASAQTLGLKKANELTNAITEILGKI